MTDEQDHKPSDARPDLPNALDHTGRDPELVHDADVHPTGLRADSRSSVPGTSVPGSPEPAAQTGEDDRVARGAEPEELED